MHGIASHTTIGRVLLSDQSFVVVYRRVTHTARRDPGGQLMNWNIFRTSGPCRRTRFHVLAWKSAEFLAPTAVLFPLSRP